MDICNIKYCKLTPSGMKEIDQSDILTKEDFDLIEKKIASRKQGYFGIPRDMGHFYLCIVSYLPSEDSSHVKDKNSTQNSKRRKVPSHKHSDKIDEIMVFTNLIDSVSWSDIEKSQCISYYLHSGLYPDIS